MTSLERKRAILKDKKQQRDKALADLADLEKKEGREREKLYRLVANKVAWFALSQPVKVFAPKTGQRVMSIDNQATWKLRMRVIAIWKMINANRGIEEIMDELIAFLKDEKARLTCADGRYGRPRGEGDGR